MENLELFEKAPNETVREYAYRVLYENIMSLKLPPGTAMSEQELSGILHVSRTPVREAFIRLSQKGLLEILPQRGTFISKIHTEQLAEFRFFRVTLERAIVELACQDFPDPWRTKLEFCIFEQGKFITSKDAEKFFKSDNTLHSLLYEGCGKPPGPRPQRQRCRGADASSLRAAQKHSRRHLCRQYRTGKAHHDRTH